jgi:hypothetical protein
MAQGDIIEFIQPVPYDISQIRRDLIEGMAASGEIVKADFKLTYWNWKDENQPKWKEVGPRSVSGDLVWKYTTTSTPFIWVDLGTEGPYPIPKNPDPMRRLKFQTGFVAKTKPGKLMSGMGGSFGPWVSPVQVEHPGIEEREFSVTVKKNQDKHLPSLMGKAVKKGVLRASRQGIRAG